MPTTLPVASSTKRKLNQWAIFFIAFYLTCFITMAVAAVPSMADMMTLAAP